jgi:hypothetical protein
MRTALCQPVNQLTPIRRLTERWLTAWRRFDRAAVDDRPRYYSYAQNDVLNICSSPEHTRCEQNARNLAASVGSNRRQ